MNVTLMKASIAFIPASLLLVVTSVLFIRHRISAHILQLIGSGAFVVVVLTHIAEALRWFPGMGWGERHSVGHYLDLSSAIAAITLFPLGWLFKLLEKR